MEETISLQEIFGVIKKRLLLIISFIIGAALIAAIVSYFLLTPIYQSSSQFIVNQSKQDAAQEMYIDQSTIRTNVELINTYNVIIKSKAILEDVVEELKLTYSPEQLAEKINVSSEENSQVVTITVKDPNPHRATEIANMTVSVFQDKIPEIMNVDNVNILSEAETALDPKPVEPRPTLNIAIAIVLGAMVGVGIAFLLEYLDTKVRSENDITEKIGIPVLGVIAHINAEELRLAKSTLTRRAQSQEGGYRNVQAQKANTK